MSSVHQPHVPPHLAQGFVSNEGTNTDFFFEDLASSLSCIYSLTLAMFPGMCRTMDPKMNCLWLVPSRSVQCGERIKQDTVGIGTRRLALRHRIPRDP